VSRITFDKTGTLTYSTPKVVDVCALQSYRQDEIYRLCASAEQYSEHPLGKAITRCYGQEHKTSLAETMDFRMIPGRGVTAVVDGKWVCAGNEKLLADEKIGISGEAAGKIEALLSQGCTVIYVAVEHTLAGYIALVDDEVKELPHLVALSKRMMTTIKLNMTFSMTLNFVAITLAIIGTLTPVVGTLVHNAGSVLVITNSAFLLKWRKKS